MSLRRSGTMAAPTPCEQTESERDETGGREKEKGEGIMGLEERDGEWLINRDVLCPLKKKANVGVAV